MNTQVAQVMAEAIEVARLPAARFPDCAEMPKVTAVYFALNRHGAILYIGRAKNVAGRWANHHRKDALAKLGCNRVAWLVVDLAMLDITEAAMIHRFAPPLNRMSIKPSGCHGSGEVKTVTTKITPRTLTVARKIAAETGEKLYAVFERVVVAAEKAERSKRGQRK